MTMGVRRLLVILLCLAILVAFSSSPTAVLNIASGMGAPPSACSNRYIGQFTSFVISYPGGEIDAMAHPNSTIVMLALNSTYDVTFTIRVANESVDNNTLTGQTWIRNNWRGYYNGECIDGAYSGGNVTQAYVIHAGSMDGHPPQTKFVEWGTEANYSAITYNVQWPLIGTNSSSSTTSSSTATVTNSSSSTTTTTTTTRSTQQTETSSSFDPTTTFLTMSSPAMQLVSLALFVMVLIFQHFLDF